MRIGVLRSFVYLFLLVLLTGCTVTKKVAFEERGQSQQRAVSVKQANRYLRGETAEIQMRPPNNSGAPVIVQAQSVVISPDSTSWFDDTGQSEVTVSNDRISSITIRSRSAATEGVLLGALSGLAASFLYWAIFPFDYEGDGTNAAITGSLAVSASIALGLVGGALIGAVVGSGLKGGPIVLEFPQKENSLWNRLFHRMKSDSTGAQVRN